MTHFFPFPRMQAAGLVPFTVTYHSNTTFVVPAGCKVVSVRGAGTIGGCDFIWPMILNAFTWFKTGDPGTSPLVQEYDGTTFDQIRNETQDALDSGGNKLADGTWPAHYRRRRANFLADLPMWTFEYPANPSANTLPVRMQKTTYEPQISVPNVLVDANPNNVAGGTWRQADYIGNLRLVAGTASSGNSDPGLSVIQPFRPISTWSTKRFPWNANATGDVIKSWPITGQATWGNVPSLGVGQSLYFYVDPYPTTNVETFTGSGVSDPNYIESKTPSVGWYVGGWGGQNSSGLGQAFDGASYTPPPFIDGEENYMPFIGTTGLATPSGTTIVPTSPGTSYPIIIPDWLTSGLYGYQDVAAGFVEIRGMKYRNAPAPVGN